MNILVTGGLGYTGIELVKKLSNTGHNVVIVDIDLYDTARFLGSCPNVKILKADILTVDWSVILRQYSIDVVYHLAGISNDPGNGVTAEFGMKINYYASVRLYESLRFSLVHKFIYPSSCSVYGLSQNNAVDETCPISPITNYARCKVMVEQYVRQHQYPNISTVLLRPATVFGPSTRQRLDLLINRTIIGALAGTAIHTPNLENSRPHVYIQDLLRVYEFFLTHGGGLNTYNIAFGNYKIRDIVRKVQLVTGKSTHICEDKKADPRTYCVNSKRILSVFPDLSKASFEENLSATVTSFIGQDLIAKIDEDIYYNKRIQEKKWGTSL